MGQRYSGKDVRIEDGPIVWVCVRKGWWHKTEEWKQVDVRDVDIDLRFTGEFRSPFGVHAIRDLNVDLRKLSHLLGVSRGDWEGAELLRADPRTIFGDLECINVGMKEMCQRSSALVFPFSAIQYIGLSPKLHFHSESSAPYADHLIGDFPWQPKQIAEAIGVPLKP